MHLIRLAQICAIVAFSMLSFVAPAAGADWPTYAADIARSNVTTESLSTPLSLKWKFVPANSPLEGWGLAEDVNIYGHDMGFLQSVRHDDHYPVAVVGNDVFFCASAESLVYCIDASTASVRWKYALPAPSRLSPTVSNGRVYISCDDGYLYCLNSNDGSLAWRFKASLGNDRIAGQFRLISVWPLRTGVLVDGNTAYVTAGIYSHMGLALYAINASTGQEIWKNTSFGSSRNGNISAQGYMAASASRLFLPTGRTNPAGFSRSNGGMVFHVDGGAGLHGGSYVSLAGDILYNGTLTMNAYNAASTGNRHYTWYKARYQVTDNGVVYMVTDTQLFAINQSAIHAAGGTASSPNYSACLWNVTHNVPHSLIKAGNLLFAGGDNKVIAVNPSNGQQVWSATVNGQARNLAVANGRLYVSTSTGEIYCFSTGTATNITISPPANPNPYPTDDKTAFYAQTAQDIANQTPATQGYALVLGGGNGRLAFELAKRTNFTIYMIEPDPAKAAQAVDALIDAGVYGSRVLVEQASLNLLQFPPVLFNLVVYEGALFGDPVLYTPATEIARVLRPSGGVAFVGQPAGGEAFGSTLSPVVVQNWMAELVDPSVTKTRTNAWGILSRGKLPGAGEWTHSLADAGNTGGSDDQLIKPPFNLLWFGQPGPEKMSNRHRRTSSPLVANGRLLVQGRNVLFCYDAYNGTRLWERDISGAYREFMMFESSNIASTDDYFFVSVGKYCYKLDAATGTTLETYTVPGNFNRWGWLAVDGNILFGSRTTVDSHFRDWPVARYYDSQLVFAIDTTTGQTLWTYSGTNMLHNGFAYGDGKVFLLDQNDISEAQIDAAIAERIAEVGDYVDRFGETLQPNVFKVVALNAATGAKLWEKPRDLVDCKVDPSGGDAAIMYKNEVVLVMGAPFHSDHQLSHFSGGTFQRRSIVGYNATTGQKVWGGPKNYQSRPLIMGDMIFAEPWGYDLQTGTQLMDGAEPWRLYRGYGGCGVSAASATTLFYRAGTGRPIGYADINDMTIQRAVLGQRPGCWINYALAGGIAVIPEASAQCTCSYAIQGSIALYPQSLNSSDFDGSRITGCHIFYNGSSFDGNNIYQNTQDDNAIAVDKIPLRPGQIATFANYTSYTAGINGIMVDIEGATGLLTLDDFTFKVGNDNNPAGWAAAPAPRSIHTRPGAGVAGADRITIIWDNNLIQKQWLQITVKANLKTGLVAAQVFYYGNAIGESGDSPTLARVDTTDEIGARQDPHKSALNPATITNRHDYNRDGKVDTLDEIFARFNRTNFTNELKLITAPE